MKRLGGGKPRVGRFLFTAALVLSMVTGAGLGNLTHRTESAAFADPMPTTTAPQTERIAFFVLPQPSQYTPSGTPITVREVGVPAKVTATAQQICDLATGTVTRKVAVVDQMGAPVSGTKVLFTVSRSDTLEPQLVGDTTDAAGYALVTVLVPQISIGKGARAGYQIVATVQTPSGATVAEFDIDNYTCHTELN